MGGSPQTHATSDETQGTPLVVPDSRHPAMDDAGITATGENGTTGVPLCEIEG